MLSKLSFCTSLALALTLVACGKDEEETPSPQPQKTIVGVAQGDARFSTLVELVVAADLVATLEGAGPFTVFAPTNEAFAKLPAGTVDALKQDKAALQKVLTYHVVAGRVDAAQASALSEATTVEGSKVTIRKDGTRLLINDAAVVQADVAAKNGLIHAIDAVLLPPEELGNIVEIASADESFSTLVAAVSSAGLVEALSGEGPFTVFAPTNAAFAALPAGAVDALLRPENREVLTTILTYHVVPGRVDAAAAASLTSATSLFGAKLNIRRQGSDLYINQARVTVTDIEASNGIIHVVDAVLLPPTITELAAATPDLSTLVTALNAAELAETLSGPGPFTVFAPVNSAFAAIPQPVLDTLLDPANKALLASVLKLHVVPGKLLAADVAAASSLTTVEGPALSVSTANGEVRVGGARVIATDIIAANGVVHLIESVIQPQN